MIKLKILFVLGILLMIGACGSSKKVAFGTHTIYGLDIDTEPTPTLSLGVDRGEIMVGPRYDNGAVPPVVASVKLKGGLFSTDVSQIYATGDAALRATKVGLGNVKKNELKGGRKTMIFGTNTNLGLKVSFVGEVPKSFSFGFKRQELSVIPIGIGGGPNGTDTYGSVLAAIDTDTEAKILGDSKFGYGAFFATGSAAESLGEKSYIQDAFKEKAQERFAAYYKSKDEQQVVSGEVLQCYIGVKDADKLGVWSDAHQNQLIDNESFEKLKNWHSEGKFRKADQGYASFINTPEGSNSTRVAQLRSHLNKVCP